MPAARLGDHLDDVAPHLRGLRAYELGGRSRLASGCSVSVVRDVAAHAGCRARRIALRHSRPSDAASASRYLARSYVSAIFSSGIGLDRARSPRGAERLVALHAQLLGRGTRASARNLRGSNSDGLFAMSATHRAGHRETDVGVDVDLANAVADALLDLLDGHAVGLGDLAAVLVDDARASPAARSSYRASRARSAGCASGSRRCGRWRGSRRWACA